MSAALEIAKAATAPAAAARPPAPLLRADAPALARRLAARFSNRWLPRVVWTIERTGRAGLAGIALLLAAALFLFSTYLKVAAEVEALRADVAAAQGRARGPARDEVADPAAAVRALPARADMPAVLRQLFSEATQARLAVDTGKYEVNAIGGSGVFRYQIAFPVTGPYPQIRAFIDETLATMPAVALSGLALERRSIADGEVEAQIRMTVYTAATGSSGSPRAGPEASPLASEARPASNRVVAPAHAAALFAQHSWLVLPPARLPPPLPAPPPPQPTAPPLPYAFLGSFASESGGTVFFLSRGDRVIDARVGDRLDGVYQLESAAGGQLVFVYLPLDIRQTLPAGAPR